MKKRRGSNMLISKKEYTDEYMGVIFEEVDVLCRIFEQNRAYEFLLNKTDVDCVPKKWLKKYYYFLGSLEIISELNPKRAKHFLNLGIIEENEKKSVYHAMLTNFMGIAYLMENDVVTAKTSFEDSLEMLDELTGLEFEELEKILLILYNCAKFYSELENANRAIELCNRGISIAKSKGILSHLEKLYYEKAYNLTIQKRRDSAEKNYSSAYSIAKIRNNVAIIEVIKSDMLKFDLELKI